MTSLSIEIPDDLKPILDGLDYQTYMSALKLIAQKKIKTKEKKIKELTKKETVFSNKYKLSFEEFNQSIPEDFQAHEDWIDWNYCHNSKIELEASISKYKFLLNK